MKLVSARCPNCGASVDLDPSMKAAYCIHCGTRLMVDDEVQRIEIKTDRTKEMNNALIIADNAFASGNYQEAYTYYTRYIKYEVNMPHVVFRRGLSAAYLSRGGSLRIPELLTGLGSAVALCQAQGDEQSILRFITEVHQYVRRAYEPNSGYHKRTRFPDREALMRYLNETIAYARLLERLLSYLPYERLKRIPSAQQLKRALIDSAMELYLRVTEKYTYVSGQRLYNGSVVEDVATFKSPDAGACLASVQRLTAEYNNVPYVNDTLYQMDQELAKLEAGAREYEALCAAFWQEHPDLYEQYEQIPFFGRKKKQQAFKQEHFPAYLLAAEQRSLDQLTRAASLKAQRKAFVSQHTK